jgi:hypothetical protein
MAANLKDRKPTNLKIVAPADPKHNQDKAKEKREKRANALRRLLHELSERNAACDVTAAAHKENTEARTETYRMIKAETGLKRPEVDAYYLALRANTRDLIAQEKQRQEDHEDLELPTFRQLDLFGDDKPKEQQDAAYWRIEGYKAGLNFLPAAAPEGCVGDNLQEFLNGHKDGAKALANSLQPAAGPDTVETAPTDGLTPEGDDESLPVGEAV